MLTKSVEQIEVILNGVTSQTVVLTKGQNIDNCVPFVSCSSNQDYAFRFLADVYFIDDPVDGPSVVVTRTNSTGITTYSIQVVEFNDEEVRVQQGTFDISSTTTHTITLDTEIVKNNSVVIGCWLVSDNTRYSARHFVRCSIESDTQIQFYRNTTTGNCSGHWFVFECLNNYFSVDHRQFSHSNVYDLILDEGVDLLNTAIINSFSTNNNSTYYNSRIITAVGFYRSDRRIRYYNNYGTYSLYQHTQIIKFNAEKIHVPYQILFFNNSLGSETVNYSNYYNDDYPLICNLNSSVVITANMYGLSFFDENSHMLYVLNRVRFENDEEINIIVAHTGTYGSVFVISWEGIDLFGHTERVNSSNSVVESIEKYYLSSSENPKISKYGLSMFACYLTNDQITNYCLPIVSFTCDSSANENSHTRDSIVVLRRPDYFIILTGILNILSTSIVVEVIEFSRNRFKEIQYKSFFFSSNETLIAIDEVNLDNTFCKFYSYTHGLNMNEGRVSFRYDSSSQLTFFVGGFSSHFFVTAYIAEAINDEVMKVNHKFIEAGTSSSSLTVDNSSDLVTNHWELISCCSAIVSNYYVAASTLYKLQSSYPRGEYKRISSYGSIVDVQLEQIMFYDKDINIYYLYVLEQVASSGSEYTLPKNINKHNSVCSWSNQSNMSCWNSSDTAQLYQTDLFYTCKITEQNKVVIERKKTNASSLNFITVIEFPEPNRYYISGTVEEELSGFVDRKVSLYRNDTGELCDTTMSSGTNGYFYLETSYSGIHSVVCNDDYALPDYNDLIYGKVIPTPINEINYCNVYITYSGCGNVTPSSDTKYLHGYDCDIAFYPSDGCALDYFYVDESLFVSELDSPIDSYSIDNIKRDYYVSIYFNDILNINVTYSGSGYTDPDGLSTVIRGRSKTVNFFPDDEKSLLYIDLNGVTISGITDEYTLNNIQEDINLFAVFDN